NNKFIPAAVTTKHVVRKETGPNAPGRVQELTQIFTLSAFLQWTGEKMFASSKTETSEDFKRLEQETELRRKTTEQLHDACSTFLKSVGKKKDGGTAVGKKMPLEIISGAMTQFGSMLHDESSYGKALLACGEAHERLAMSQIEFLTKARDGYVASLGRILTDMKEYQHAKTKLESRRLDFDAKLNRVHKSKKEKPELEEDTRVAQMKYEESLTDTTQRMIALNTNDDEQLETLCEFVENELAYHRKAVEILYALNAMLEQIPREQHEHRSRSMSPSRGNSISGPPGTNRMRSASNSSYNGSGMGGGFSNGMGGGDMGMGGGAGGFGGGAVRRQNSAQSFDGMMGGGGPGGPGGAAAAARKLSYAANAGAPVLPMQGGPQQITMPPRPSSRFSFFVVVCSSCGENVEG
ncbi:hypothetical protein HK102_007364, partial [Quaeritorhiza haematococci]